MLQHRVAPATERAAGTALKASEETANASAVTSRVASSPALSCLAAQHRCRTCTGISSLKDVSLPHSRCFIEGRFKFGDQIPLLFAKLFFSFLTWKCSLNKAKEDAAGIFKTCWQVCVAVNPFRAVGWVGVHQPCQHHSEVHQDLMLEAPGRAAPPGRASQWHRWTDRQTEEGLGLQQLHSSSTTRRPQDFSSLPLCPHCQAKGLAQNSQL